MLGLYGGAEGLVLASDPYMPIALALNCALFDIIQCAEALAKCGLPVPSIQRLAWGMVAVHSSNGNARRYSEANARYADLAKFSAIVRYSDSSRVARPGDR